MRWRFLEPRTRSFKTFRNGPNFETVAQDIAAHVKQIMKYCTRIESGFVTLGIERVTNDYATGDFDFNDQVVTEI